MKKSLYEKIISLIEEVRTRANHFEELEKEYFESKDYVNAYNSSIRMSECDKQVRDLNNLIS